jgi:hypothetical protein
MEERQGKSEQNYTAAARAAGIGVLGLLITALAMILF